MVEGSLASPDVLFLNGKPAPCLWGDNPVPLSGYPPEPMRKPIVHCTMRLCPAPRAAQNADANSLSTGPGNGFALTIAGYAIFDADRLSTTRHWRPKNVEAAASARD
jgi:hypothetical protein